MKGTVTIQLSRVVGFEMNIGDGSKSSNIVIYAARILAFATGCDVIILGSGPDTEQHSQRWIVTEDKEVSTLLERIQRLEDELSSIADD